MSIGALPFYKSETGVLVTGPYRESQAKEFFVNYKEKTINVDGTDFYLYPTGELSEKDLENIVNYIRSINII